VEVVEDCLGEGVEEGVEGTGLHEGEVGEGLFWVGAGVLW